jgi:uncharacterized membrane protein YdjX (TVP38/TMEM64 family)
MKSHTAAYVGLVLVVVLSGLSFVWDAPSIFMKSLIGENIFLAAALFVLLMFGATVVAPVTVIPLVPLISPTFGPFLTALLCILGWTLGAVVAFLIARHAGRPLLVRLVSLETLSRYEKHVDTNIRFWGIVMLRMLIPVDVLSYALGLFSNVPLLEYTAATALGISYFAFVFSYMGVASFDSNLPLFIGVALVSIVIFGFGWWFVIKRTRQGRNE